MALTQTARNVYLSSIDPRALELILLPTEQCNFRCTYCYEDFSIGKMKRPTIDGVKRLMEGRAAELKQLTLSWFGGEPLVARDVVYEITAHAQQLVARYPGLLYHSSMTTNAYFLTPETCAELSARGVRQFQISLDGWGEVHDTTRRRADGKGTFERIWKHLLWMQASDLPLDVLIRVHLQPHSAESIDELVRELHRHFAGDRRFDVLFKPVGNWGGPNSDQLAVLGRQQGQELAAGLREQWSAARGGPSRRPQTEETPYVCYAARPNSLVVRADGHVGKCTVMLQDKRNRIGTLREDGRLELEAGRLAPWMRGFRSFDAGALSCPAVGLPKQEELLTTGAA